TLIHGIVSVGVAEARSTVSKIRPMRNGVMASSKPTAATKINETVSAQPYGRTYGHRGADDWRRDIVPFTASLLLMSCRRLRSPSLRLLWVCASSLCRQQDPSIGTLRRNGSCA